MKKEPIINLNIFHFDFEKENFESKSQENGFTFWLASEFVLLLGYESLKAAQKPIDKAMTACNTLTVPIIENFIHLQNIDEAGKSSFDFKLSRFACYLVAMNSDVRKPNVAQAQAYFATIAGAIQDHINESKEIERLIVRGEIAGMESSIHRAAKNAAVENYAHFQNAGYRGMYNMNIWTLRKLRHIDSNRSPLDFMGKAEMAANLFRLTQTEQKIQNENLKGQKDLENAAESVGTEVRNLIIKTSGTTPERLTSERDIKKIKSEMGQKRKKLAGMDKKKTLPKPKKDD